MNDHTGGMSHDVPVRVDHVGMAVERIDDAAPFLEALGAREYVREESADGEVVWAGFRLGDASGLELVEPTGPDSFLAAWLDEHGPGLHHVTLEVADVDAAVEGLRAAGVRVVDLAHHPEEGYGEAFVSPANPTGTLFQLMEFHDGYAPDHGGDDAYVGGHRVGREGEP